MRMRRILPGLLAAGALALSGCAAFQNYNEVMAPARESFASGRYAEARVQLTGKKPEAEFLRGDQLVPFLETGLIDHTAGRFKESSAAFLRGTEIIKQQEDKAVISLSNTAAYLGTLIVNEGAAPYQGESFEKTLIHTFLAINYLMQCDLEGAGVEARRCYRRQEEVARLHERELGKARRENEKAKRQEAPLVDRDLLDREIVHAYRDQDSAASRVANAYQNPFTNCLCAFIFRARNESNDAYLELKRAYTIRPRTPLLGPLLIETAWAGGFQEDIAQWEAAFGLRREEVLADAAKNPAEVWILYENGWAPLKRQITIAFPTPEGMVKIAIPKYQVQPGAAQALEVSCNGRRVRTDLLGDLEAQAIRSRRDRMRILAIKMTLRIVSRLVAERELRQWMAKEFGVWGELFAIVSASAVNLGLERADLRCWSLLPRNLQMARLRLPEGAAIMELRFLGLGTPSRQVKVNLRAGTPTIVLARSAGYFASVWISQLAASWRNELEHGGGTEQTVHNPDNK